MGVDSPIKLMLLGREGASADASRSPAGMLEVVRVRRPELRSPVRPCREELIFSGSGPESSSTSSRRASRGPPAAISDPFERANQGRISLPWKKEGRAWISTCPHPRTLLAQCVQYSLLSSNRRLASIVYDRDVKLRRPGLGPSLTTDRHLQSCRRRA